MLILEIPGRKSRNGAGVEGDRKTKRKDSQT